MNIHTLSSFFSSLIFTCVSCACIRVYTHVRVYHSTCIYAYFHVQVCTHFVYVCIYAYILRYSRLSAYMRILLRTNSKIRPPTENLTNGLPEQITLLLLLSLRMVLVIYAHTRKYTLRHTHTRPLHTFTHTHPRAKSAR